MRTQETACRTPRVTSESAACASHGTSTASAAEAQDRLPKLDRKTARWYVVQDQTVDGKRRRK
jgi:hypothetical protein